MGRKSHQPFSITRHSASNQRPMGARRPQPGLSTSKAIIDQRLIEGAQISQPWNRPRGHESENVDPCSQLVGPDLQSFRSDDHQLDAFDLELLAQSDESNRNPLRQPVNMNYPSVQQRNYGEKHVSRFFQTSSHITPLRNLDSSSSDLGLGSPSSPLSRLQPGKTIVIHREREYQAKGPSRQYHEDQLPHEEESPSHGSSTILISTAQCQKSPFENIPMSVRGIVLVSIHELPDSYRSIFHFPVFNAVQSKCFQRVYKTDDNIVLAAPTGSGKTVIMELAICRLLSTLKDERFKVVYQAPTKSLCSERFRDWNRKFMSLGLQCAELTGDTDHTQLRSVQNSQIIVTTPEKWDSMTRKWKDHAGLMQLVKLFLIDEVHILKEARGATLEAVVSRMKTFGSNVRFVALSATVPNSGDIASWLGKDATNQHVPAHREHFGEDFRPVKLQKFVYGYQSHSNDFAFDKLCSSKNSCIATAKELARLWSMTNPPARLWKVSGKHLEAHNADLRTTLMAGVAFHHAGLDPADRHTVESGYLQAHIAVICCTSTLAVGVNLPCHLVIIKGTVGWQDGGCKEYSDLEMMQMLGRAGRPQFDDSAIAVIMTRKERVQHYEKLVSGSETLESCLHLNLIDHLNAEIGLGAVTDVDSAVRWLAGTFLFVRLRRNPKHYHLKEGATKDDEDEMLRQICEKDIKLLQETGLIASDRLKSTPFGDAMARYYVRFDTMKTLLALKPHATISQVLAAIAEAEEFREIRLKAGEKSLYKELNRVNGIRFPVKVDIALPAHKILLLIQSELGGVEYPDGEQYQKHKFAFQQDKNFVFSHINRLIRCLIDCQISLEDSIAARNALELARSFGAKVWDNCPLQMKQIDQVGIVAVRKLAAAGITSIDALEAIEPHRIDMIMSRNPPFGMKLLARVAEFPKLRVNVKLVGKEIKPGKPVRIRFKAEIAFMNEKTPTFFQRRPVYVCFLAETSDGHLIDFRRISANKLRQSQEIPLDAELKSPGLHITCYAMCDEIAGTLMSAELKPELPNVFFPSRPRESQAVESMQGPRMSVPSRDADDTPINANDRRADDSIENDDNDDWLFDDLMETDEASSWAAVNQSTGTPRSRIEEKGSKECNSVNPTTENEKEPSRLVNGRYACNHRCRDKTTCKHLCCREGLEKPHKAARKQSANGNPQKSGLNQLTLSASIPRTKAGRTSTIEARDKGSGKTRTKDVESTSIDLDITDSGAFVNLASTSHVSKPQYFSSDYGDDSFDDLPSPSKLLVGCSTGITTQVNEKTETFASKCDDITEADDTWTDVDDLFTYPVQPSSIDSPEQVKIYTATSATGKQDQTLVPPDNSAFERNAVSNGNDIPRTSGTNVDKALDPSRVSDEHSGRKRNLSWQCEGVLSDERMAKRTKHDEPYQIPRGQVATAIKTSRSVQGPANLPEVPKDWDDIDPALLDEFKDIVNFF
ncbi:putative DEAD/DEAH box DNA helicase (Mer3) [Aspergillus novofumigatus IBT 16806]|uniref:DNA 3'-5' helicase n=1 Tax=Aspergillus novofumigatus (strain IBT 16806) TaxID=1392255 RepID=A0A2I1CBL1_ASPN1|nr:putative DEAD/DEAH box DNA helicase [Aspergillus novofumigatus IBT 16806]PKX95012.1 putative DEAD/DEAH box DNA helicase [Aspergillus novofumigatus IBT 16806]